MFRFLSSIVSPTTRKLVSSQNKPWPWLPLRFISTTSSSSSSISKDDSFTVSYLTGTCGLSPERAITFSKYLAFENGERPDLVIKFFENHCFSKTKALKVIQSIPLLLRANPDKSFKPKIDFFKSIGFSSSDISKIIVNCPLILTRSLDSEIVPAFDFFSNMFQSKDTLMKAIARNSGILFGLEKISLPNIKLMREEGIHESHIARFVEYYPRSLKSCRKRFEETLQAVKELGFNPSRLQFVVAVHVKLCVGSSWKRKEDIYRRWGWGDGEISAAFKTCPWCIAVSDNKIEAVMDFLVNKLGYTPSDIAKTPVVLTMSLEKRIMPRGSVILALMSRGLVSQLSLSAIYKVDEPGFLRKYVRIHAAKANELLRLYEAQLALEK